MHKGNIEMANALSAQISKDITRQNKTRLGKLNIFNSKTRPKALWSVVRQLTGAKCDTAHIDGITADSLNTHYASVSTDPQYAQLSHKPSCSPSFNQFVSELTIFHILDKLPPTSTGLDSISAWFLRLSAPIFCKSIAHLFNISLSSSFVPPQCSVHGSLQSPKFPVLWPLWTFAQYPLPPFSAHHGASCRSSILIPCVPLLLSRVTGILGPVRLSTHRFHHLCPCLVPSYHNPIAYSTSLRHCASTRFQQSLWHRPALHPPR